MGPSPGIHGLQNHAVRSRGAAKLVVTSQAFPSVTLTAGLTQGLLQSTAHAPSSQLLRKLRQLRAQRHIQTHPMQVHDRSHPALTSFVCELPARCPRVLVCLILAYVTGLAQGPLACSAVVQPRGLVR